jgi:hypothetical protein
LYVSAYGSISSPITQTLNGIEEGMNGGELAGSNPIIIYLRYIDPSSKAVATNDGSSSSVGNESNNEEWPIILGAFMGVGMILMLLAVVQRRKKLREYEEREYIEDPSIICSSGESPKSSETLKVETVDDSSYCVDSTPIDPWEQPERQKITLNLDNGYCIEGRTLLSVAEALSNFICSNYGQNRNTELIQSPSSERNLYITEGDLSYDSVTTVMERNVSQDMHTPNISSSLDENLLSVEETFSDTNLSFSTADGDETNSQAQSLTKEKDEDLPPSPLKVMDYTNGYMIEGKDLMLVANEMTTVIRTNYTDSVSEMLIAEHIPHDPPVYSSESVTECIVAEHFPDEQPFNIASAATKYFNSYSNCLSERTDADADAELSQLDTEMGLCNVDTSTVDRCTDCGNSLPDTCYKSPTHLIHDYECSSNDQSLQTIISSNQSTPVMSNTINDNVDADGYVTSSALDFCLSPRIELSVDVMNTCGKEKQDSPTSYTNFCAICKKGMDGKPRRLCQCGKTGCTFMAHSTCALDKFPLPSVSHPGTPPPVAFILCREKGHNFSDV